jgi:hypothetical protein
MRLHPVKSNLSLFPLQLTDPANFLAQKWVEGVMRDMVEEVRVDDLLKKARPGYPLFAASPRSHPDSVSGVASATLRGLRPTLRLPKGAT